MKLIDLTGRRFGRLSVIERSAIKRWTNAVWRCACECGTETAVIGSQLLTGKTKSCGCLQREVVGRLSRTHGLSKTAEYKIWSGIKTRCYNAKNRHYDNYGARGIKMSDAWRAEFGAFLSDMGHRPSANHTVERVDNDGDYCAENCKWLLLTEQAKNRRNTLAVTCNGVTKSPKEWAKGGMVSEGAIRERLNNGWSDEDAVSTPMRSTHNVNRPWKSSSHLANKNPQGI